MLTPGKRVPTGELWSGRPATYMRGLTQAAIEGMREGVAHYVANGQAHARAVAECADGAAQN
jgi:carbonic anhydrase/acetyltransferase-like protein (isoleucine patch superfamily)